MAWTYTTLSAAIQSYLQTTETNFVAYIPTFIRQCEDRISKGVILPAARKEANLNLTEGNAQVSLPSDFLAPFSLLVNNVGVFTPVAIQDVSYCRETYPNPLMVGVPRYYAMFDDSHFLLAPTPTLGLSVWVNYFYKPESIVTAGTSWLGTNAENCLLYGCLAEAYLYLKGDPDLMKAYEEKFQAGLAQLKTLGEGLDMGDAFRMGERRVRR